MKKLIIATALAAAVSPTANADGMTGEELYGLCTGTVKIGWTGCMAYTNGIADGIHASQAANSHNDSNCYNLTGICFPAEYTGQQVQNIFVEYVRDHPDVGKWGADVAVMYALADAWPCRR